MLKIQYREDLIFSWAVLTFQWKSQCYAKKANLIRARGTDTSMLVSTTELSSQKTEVDYLDMDKNKTVPDNRSKRCNLVDNDVFKNCV